MSIVRLAIALVLAAATPARAEPHACSADAIVKAESLLRFHVGTEAAQPVDV